MKKLLMVFGTRPEAIKMAPLYRELKSRPTAFDTKLCVTAQHRQQLDQVLAVFDIVPDYDLNIMRDRQTLDDVICHALIGLHEVLEKEKPDIVLVHGDTATTFGAALAAFHQRIAVGHVEAGLRTWDKLAPFPEELYRQMTDDIADYYFAPTELSKENLRKEGKDPTKIFVTGNTAIDAIQYTVREDYSHPELERIKGTRLLLLTAHRRENLGEPMLSMFRGIRRAMDRFPDVRVIYPVHLNPAVREAADAIFAGDDRVRLIEPLEIIDFHNFIKQSYIVVTDSGGIQEEAPSFGKPVLVTRDVTERPEGVEAGTLKLVGTDENRICDEIVRLLSDTASYERMSRTMNPYGDGMASKRIADALETGRCGEFV